MKLGIFVNQLTEMSVAVCSLTIMPSEKTNDFTQRILTEIKTWPEAVGLGVFPEYCWGSTKSSEIFEQVSIIKNAITSKLILILGTTSIDNGNGIITNNALILTKNNPIQFIPKTHTLMGERMRSNVIDGENTGVIEINGLRIGVLICADLWDGDLVKQLATTQRADLLAIPAFTTVPKGYSAYAKQQWYSLSISRSREFVIPILVADHAVNGEEYDVGSATNIADPSKKHDQMVHIKDFLDLPDNATVVTKLDFDAIREYRKYRMQTGLLG
jgi:predicted amidohydrolase